MNDNHIKLEDDPENMFIFLESANQTVKVIYRDVETQYISKDF